LLVAASPSTLTPHGRLEPLNSPTTRP